MDKFNDFVEKLIIKFTLQSQIDTNTNLIQYSLHFLNQEFYSSTLIVFQLIKLFLHIFDHLSSDFYALWIYLNFFVFCKFHKKFFHDLNLSFVLPNIVCFPFRCSFFKQGINQCVFELVFCSFFAWLKDCFDFKVGWLLVGNQKFEEFQEMIVFRRVHCTEVFHIGVNTN